MAQPTEVETPVKPAENRSVPQETHSASEPPAARSGNSLASRPHAKIIAIVVVLVLLVGGFFAYEYFQTYESTDDAQVELKTRQQELIQAKNNLAIQKLALARVIGLAPGQEFELTDKSPYEPFAGMKLDEALQLAYDSRSDFKAASATVHSYEYSAKAAKAEYLPTISFTGDYGLAGEYATLGTHGVFDARGTLNIPIFQGGKVHGDVIQANAQLEQSRQRLENLRAQVDSDVRTAFFNLQSSAEQVEVARSNIDLAQQTLDQSRDRFVAGVADTVEVVQAQEQVANANDSYISALYSFNYAKISLARSLGLGEQSVREYFKGK